MLLYICTNRTAIQKLVDKKSQVGDLRAEIKIFYRWVRYGPFCFCYRMRCLRYQIATACAVGASILLPYAQCALANCYRMRSVR
jgi:hypothetical protein